MTKENKPVGRPGIGSSGITSWTLNPPDYFHNQQRETSKPVVQPLPNAQSKIVTTKAEVAPAEEKPKKKRAPRKKKAPPHIEIPLDSVQEIVEQDLIKRGFRNPQPED